jgi:hypothetical protein
MRVEIRAGGEGVACWNRQAIQDFADRTNEREQFLAQHNPDLVVSSGRVKCYGCEVQEYDYGLKCTAELTKTVYAVAGEVQPRAADAVGLHREIPGLVTIKPDSETAPAPTRAGGQNTAPAPAPRRRLFGRS